LTTKQANELKSIFKTNSSELKFNRLKKYFKYHEQLIEFLNHDIISKETVALALFHQEYCICVYTIVRLVETLAY